MDIAAEAGLERFEREDSYQIFFKGYIFSFKSVGVPWAESLIRTFLMKFRAPQHWEQDESKAWETCHTLNHTRACSSRSCLMFSGGLLCVNETWLCNINSLLSMSWECFWGLREAVCGQENDLRRSVLPVLASRELREEQVLQIEQASIKYFKRGKTVLLSLISQLC